MYISFKHTDEPLEYYPQILPVKGEILIKTKYKYASLWTRDINDTLIPIIQGWDTKYLDLNLSLNVIQDISLDENALAAPQYLTFFTNVWIASSYNITTFANAYFDAKVTKYTPTTTSIAVSNTPVVGSVLSNKTIPFTPLFYSTRTTSSAPTAGQWTLTTFGSNILVLRLNRTDGFNVLSTARIRSIVNNYPVIILNIGGRRYVVNIVGFTDLLDTSSARIDIFLPLNLFRTSLQYLSNTLTASLTIEPYIEFTETRYNNLIALPDGGDFSNSTFDYSRLSVAPDGGLVRFKQNYLYTRYLGSTFTPAEDYGEFSTPGTTILRIAKRDIQLTPFPINSFGGLNGPIPVTGLTVRAYRNTGIQTAILSSGTNTWFIQEEYYQITITNTNLITLFTGATAMEILRPNTNEYEWVA